MDIIIPLNVKGNVYLFLKDTKTELLGKINYWLWNHCGIPENELSKLNWNDLENWKKLLMKEYSVEKQWVWVFLSKEKKRYILTPKTGMSIGWLVQQITILYCLIFFGFTFSPLILHTLSSTNPESFRFACNIIRKSKFIIDTDRSCYIRIFNLILHTAIFFCLIGYVHPIYLIQLSYL